MVHIENSLNSSKIPVMIVDDSAVIRRIMREIITSDPQLEVIASAENGAVALEHKALKSVKVIVLDIEMPVMDGLTALPKLLAQNPNLIVIIASTLTSRNADISLKALRLGATDYIHKPSFNQTTEDIDEFKKQLCTKIKVLCVNFERRAQYNPLKPLPSTNYSLRPMPFLKPQAIVIGSSTGGPQALLKLFESVRSLPCPLLIVQHMPPRFTEMLAKQIRELTGIPTFEASEGMSVEHNKIIVAPGDFHMTVIAEQGQIKVHLDQGSKQNYCRPSVDPLFESAAAIFGSRLLGVMLTGMGSDGLKGSQRIVETGGTIIAQDESTSIVWGMPKAVTEAGLCSAVVPLPKMFSTIESILKRKESAHG